MTTAPPSAFPPEFPSRLRGPVGIVGLGLIGGSLGLDLQALGVEVRALRFALYAVSPGTCLAGCSIEIEEPLGPLGGSTADCDGSSDPTEIGGAPPTIYDPGESYLIDVWVHVLRDNSGVQGNIPVEELYEQIAILAEDRPDDLREAYTDALSRGPNWRERLERSLMRSPAAAERLAAC